MEGCGGCSILSFPLQLHVELNDSSINLFLTPPNITNRMSR